MKNLVQEIVKYGAVSACALIVDFAILFGLVDYFCWWYLLAATTSFTAGLVVAYALSITFVFRHRRLNNPRAEFASFAGIGVVGVAINAVVMSVAVKVLGFHYLIAKCGAAGFTFIWNFAARRRFLFVETARPEGL